MKVIGKDSEGLTTDEDDGAVSYGRFTTLLRCSNERRFLLHQASLHLSLYIESH